MLHPQLKSSFLLIRLHFTLVTCMRSANDQHRAHINGKTQYYGMIKWFLDTSKPGSKAKPAQLTLTNSKDFNRRHDIEVSIK